MATSFTLSTSIHDRAPTARLAAMAWSLGGAVWLAAAFVYGSGWRFDASILLFLVANGLVAAGMIALFALRPHGSSRVGSIALGAALVARAAFVAGEITSFAQGHDDNPFLPIGALLTALAMTTYGVVVLRRGEVRGPGRWAFLAVGLYPFVGMFPVVAITGEPSFVLIALWGVPIASVGLACGLLGQGHNGG
jgi:hypothetical protein